MLIKTEKRGVFSPVAGKHDCLEWISSPRLTRWLKEGAAAVIDKRLWPPSSVADIGFTKAGKSSLFCILNGVSVWSTVLCVTHGSTSTQHTDFIRWWPSIRLRWWHLDNEPSTACWHTHSYITTMAQYSILMSWLSLNYKFVHSHNNESYTKYIIFITATDYAEKIREEFWGWGEGLNY